MHYILHVFTVILEIVKYLHDVFGLDKTDAQADNNYALYEACSKGHIEVVKYLHDIFGLDKTDAQIIMHYILHVKKVAVKLSNIYTIFLD